MKRPALSEKRMAGCYGKIPALGDFLSRNLPATFVEAWDGWLRQVMAGCARSGGNQWVDHYLSSPIWRFAFSPGVVGATGRAGIVAPSVDSVGRCFPLTIAAELPDALAPTDAADVWADGYERAEMMAIGALGRALDPEAFAGRVAALESPALQAVSADPPIERWNPTSVPALGVRIGEAPDESGGARGLASALALAMLQGARDGISLWWHLDWEGRPASTVMFAGLPPPEAVASMLLGLPEDQGWRP